MTEESGTCDDCGLYCKTILLEVDRNDLFRWRKFEYLDIIGYGVFKFTTEGNF